MRFTTLFRKMATEAVDIKQGLEVVRDQIKQACLRRSPELQCIDPILVAVGKTKPKEMIIQAYESGQRHFGENYVKELHEKGTDPTLIEQCSDIKWHFIGNLQRNKVNKLVSVPNLYLVETVDSFKLAETLDAAWKKFKPVDKGKLKIMLQVNTSQEEEKNGMEASEVIEVAKNVIKTCENLELIGLMTIGKYGYDVANGPNPDFLSLIKCRNELSSALNLKTTDLHLSMGMSNDFEQAIELGSSMVRVGTAIFGYRAMKTK